jgi:hypothetical protein
MEELPKEILKCIANKCPKITLLNLVTVNKLFFSIAEDMLLKKHMIKYQYRQLKWFNTSKATHVNFGCYTNYNLKTNKYETYVTSITDKMLSLLPNLMTLTFIAHKSYKWIKKISSINNLKNLKRLILYRFNEQLKKINLNDLYILEIHDKFISTNILYNLKHLTISMNLMGGKMNKMLMKTPNLISLTLNNYSRIDSGITDNDIINLHNLRHLNIYGMYAFHNITGGFINKCPTLKTLYFITGLHIDPNVFSTFNGSSLAIKTDVMTDDVLSKLTKLEKLFICCSHIQLITNISISKLINLEVLAIDSDYYNITSESLSQLHSLKKIYCNKKVYDFVINDDRKIMCSAKDVSCTYLYNPLTQRYFFSGGNVNYSKYY